MYASWALYLLCAQACSRRSFLFFRVWGFECECSVKWYPRVYMIGPGVGGVGVSDDALASCSHGSTALSIVGEC